ILRVSLKSRAAWRAILIGVQAARQRGRNRRMRTSVTDLTYLLSLSTMVPTSDSVAPPRRQARDIIDAVVDNMHHNLERLKYSTLAPSRYTVYLHPGEYTRLEGIVPILREQTARALTE